MPYPYVAHRDIELNGLLTFAAGDGVPAEHVKKFGLRVGTDAQNDDVYRVESPADYPEAGPVGLVDRPNRSASKDEWISYAVRTGRLTGEEATGLSKDDLIRRASDTDAGAVTSAATAAGDEPAG